GHAQIILAEEKNIETRHGCNFIDVLDAIGSLDLHGANDVIVPFAGITQQALLVHTALWKVYGSSSGRRVPATGYILPDVVGSVDVRTKYSVRAHVQSLLDAGPVRVPGA